MRNRLLNLLFISGLIGIQFCWSQKIERIEFEHSNSIIIGREINITFEPLKNNKKGTIKIEVNKDGEKYSTRIRKEKFMIISDAICKINPSDLYTINEKDTLLLGNYLDVSSSSITIYNDKQNKKSFYAENLGKKSQYDDKQKYFWYATKLIMNAAKLRMEDLIDYR